MPDQFHPFTWLHLLTVLACAGLMVGSCIIGRRWLGQGDMGQRRERRFVAAWAWFIIAWQLWTLLYWLVLNFDLGTSLPLHICDLVVWVAALALLTPSRSLRTVLYFWGIGLSTQAFFTPTLNEGPAAPQFWLFWIGHTQIVGSAVYDVVVRHYRPALRDYLLISVVNAAYLALIFPFDTLLGLNYGYIGRSPPSQPTLIDHLGPWPMRVLWMVLIVQVVLAAAWLFWPACGRLKRRLRPDASNRCPDRPRDTLSP